MKSGWRVTVAGHLCMDLVPPLAAPLPDPGELVDAGPLELRLGGCVANTGLALAALGAPVRLAALVGADLLGDAVRAMLAGRADTGLSVQLDRVTTAGTSYSVVLQPPGVDRRFLHHVGANAVFDGGGLPPAGTDLLHIGYPQLLPRLLESGGAGLAELLRRSRAAGVTTSVDFATVAPARVGDHPWPELVARWAPDIDVLTPSVADLRPAFPEAPEAPEASEDLADLAGNAGNAGFRAAAWLADALVDAGVGIAMVTAGPAGMCLRSAGAERLRGGGAVLASLPEEWADQRTGTAAPATAPVRTTGAGDTATAGLLFGLLAGWWPAAALRLAASAASWHVAGRGDLPGWRELWREETQ